MIYRSTSAKTDGNTACTMFYVWTAHGWMQPGDTCKNNLELPLRSVPRRPIDRRSALRSHVLTARVLRGETDDRAAAAEGKRWNHRRQPNVPSHHKTLHQTPS